MSRLFSLITRVGIWALFGAGVGYVVVLAYELFLGPGALNMTSANAGKGAFVGAIIGGIIGFTRRS